MTEKEKLAKIRERLVSKRDALFGAHRRTEDVRRSLLEPEVEFEETAKKENLADVMASFDEQEEKEVEAIDRALTRIELCEYQVCESCCRRISLRRLEAIPWTTYCARCAKQREEQAAGGPLPEEAAPASPERADFPKAEEIKAIFDELREDGGIDAAELRIALLEGSVHLEGVLPTEAQHQRLIEVVEDHIGLANVLDEIVVSSLPWESPDRASGTKTIEEISAELIPEEEDVGPGPFESRRTGTPFIPPDTLEPEEE